jgi:signal transduction histidine kinase
MPPVQGEESAKGASVIANPLAGIALAACLAVAALSWFSVVRSRAHYRVQAEITTQNLCQVLGDSLTSTYDKVDLALMAVKDEAEHQPASGEPIGLRLKACLDRHRARIPALDAIRMAGAEGIIESGMGVPAGSRISIADRDYFLRLREHPEAGMVISRPNQSRVTGTWQIVLARRINHPDGTFGGVVFGTMPLVRIATIFDSIALGPHGVISLRDEDMGIIIRRGGTGGGPGQSQISAEYRALVNTGALRGTYTAVAPVDQTKRIMSFYRLQPYAQILNVALGERDVMDPWRREARITLGLAALFTALIGLSATMAHQAWRRLATAEAVVRAANTELEARVQARTAELVHANTGLQEMNQLKASFTAMLVHDLRSPLSGIGATLELFANEGAIVPSLLEGCRKSITNVVGMLSDLMELYRSEGCEMPLDARGTPPLLILGPLLEKFALQAQAKDIRLDLSCPPDMPEIAVDPLKVDRILSNLVGNAIKFTPAGGQIRVEVNRVEGTGVDLGLKWLLISVTDTGCGIPPEHLPYIFDPYRQVSTRDAGRGFGLGLAIVQRLMAAHKGRVLVRSQVGVGTTFLLYFPLG